MQKILWKTQFKQKFQSLKKLFKGKWNFNAFVWQNLKTKSYDKLCHKILSLNFLLTSFQSQYFVTNAFHVQYFEMFR